MLLLYLFLFLFLFGVTVGGIITATIKSAVTIVVRITIGEGLIGGMYCLTVVSGIRGKTPLYI